MNRTPLRHPRTASEAFKGLEYSCAIERPARRYPRLLWAILLAGLFVALWTART